MDFYKIKLVGKKPDVPAFADTLKYATKSKVKGNYGILTGHRNNIVVVDLDFYDKKEKQFNFNNSLFIKEFGKEFINLFNTYTQRTANGGFHLFFKYDEEIRQTKNSNHQIDIRNDGGYVVGVGSVIDNKEYTVYNNTSIKKIPSNLKKWLLANLYTKEEKERILRKKENKEEIPSNFKYDVDEDLIKLILDNLPKEYYRDYGSGKSGKRSWLTFTTMMKQLNCFDLWDQYSKKYGGDKYNKSQNIKLWNRANVNYDCFSQIFNDKALKDFKHLKYYIRYKQLDCENIKYDFEIDRQKLGYDFLNEFEGDLVIKSDTGTGKTTSFKHYQKYQDKPFISVVSRVSLGLEQYAVFNKHGVECDFYQYVAQAREGFKSYKSYVITIDSLLKLFQDDFDFAYHNIFLDEFNSIIEHLINAEPLKNKRIQIFEYLKDILKNCSRFICVDADISGVALDFLSFTGREFKTIKNNYKHNSGVECEELEHFNDLINKLKNEDKFIVCCDSKKNSIYLEDKLRNEQGIEGIKLITSETEERIDLDKYDKIIYSPKIIYGLDSTIKRSVFCYFNTKSINPAHMIQQIARTRKIVKLYYFFESKYLNNCDYLNLADCENITNKRNKLKDIATKHIGINRASYNEFLKIYNKLIYKLDCYNSNVFYHFIKLLKNRGFTVPKKYIKTSFKSCFAQDKKVIATDYLNDVFNRESQAFKQVNKILKLKNSQIEQFKDIIIDNNLIKNHFDITDLFIKEDIEDIKKKLYDQQDFAIIKYQSNTNKIIFLREFLNKLNFNICDYINNCKRFDIELIKDKEEIKKLTLKYRLLFLDRRLKLDLTDKQTCLKVIAKMFKNILPNAKKLIKTKREQINNKRVMVYSFDEDLKEELKIHRDLYQIRSPNLSKYDY